MLLVGLCKWGWRLVRIVRIVKVHPNESWSARMGTHPRIGASDHVYPAPLQKSPMPMSHGGRREIVVVVEAAVEPRGQRPRVENDRADKRRRLITVLLQQFRPGRDGLSQRNSEIGDTMNARQQAGQYAGMRRVGDWAGRECLGKANAIARERIQRGCLDVVIPVTMNVIGTQRINRY